MSDNGPQIGSGNARAFMARIRHHRPALRPAVVTDYVTPNDEHKGRGGKIRQARRDGLQAADIARRLHHRSTRHTHLQR